MDRLDRDASVQGLPPSPSIQVGAEAPESAMLLGPTGYDFPIGGPETAHVNASALHKAAPEGHGFLQQLKAIGQLALNLLPSVRKVVDSFKTKTMDPNTRTVYMLGEKELRALPDRIKALTPDTKLAHTPEQISQIAKLAMQSGLQEKLHESIESGQVVTLPLYASEGNPESKPVATLFLTPDGKVNLSIGEKPWEGAFKETFLTVTLADPTFKKAPVLPELRAISVTKPTEQSAGSKFNEKENEVSIHKFLSEVPTSNRDRLGVAHAYTAGTEAALATHFYTGGDMKALIAQGKASPAQQIHYAHDVLRGLRQLHSSGVIHRDVTPANIMVDGDGHARIIDFGNSALKGEKLNASREIQMAYYPTSVLKMKDDTFGLLQEYAAAAKSGESPEALPALKKEALKARKEYESNLNTASNDIYAAGLVMLQLFAGVQGMTEEALVDKDMWKAPDSTESLSAAAARTRQDLIPKMLARVPAEAKWMIQRMLSDDTAQRPSAGEAEIWFRALDEGKSPIALAELRFPALRDVLSPSSVMQARLRQPMLDPDTKKESAKVRSERLAWGERLADASQKSPGTSLAIGLYTSIDETLAQVKANPERADAAIDKLVEEFKRTEPEFDKLFTAVEHFKEDMDRDLTFLARTLPDSSKMQKDYQGLPQDARKTFLAELANPSIAILDQIHGQVNELRRLASGPSVNQLLMYLSRLPS